MPFILTNERVVTRHPFADGTMLAYRRFEGDERDQFEKQRALIAGRKNFWPMYVKLLAQTAALLCVEWVVHGPDDKPIECTPENRLAFHNHRETRKYWWKPIYDYINPERDDADETIDLDSLPEAEEPDFFTLK